MTAASAEAPRGPTPWAKIFTSPAMACVCAQQFFRAAGYIFYLTWFPRFLQEARNVAVEESGYLTSFPLLGVVAGSASGGLLADWIYRRTGSHTLSRKGVAITALLFSAAFLGSAYFTHDAWLTVSWLTLSSFFAGVCGPAGYTVTIDLGGKHVATVFSLMNMAGNIGAALLPLAIDRFERWLTEISCVQHSWNEVLFFLAGLYVCAAVCWSLLRIEPSRLSFSS